MKIELPEDVMKSLPEPAGDGLVRVTVGLKVSPEGAVELSEVNDMPVPTGGDEAEPGGEEDSEDGAPDLGAMAQDIYGPDAQ